ncbi:MAG: DUF4301 family protein [Flavobacteriaceae bacterium]|nr:DUF4301 family protein [Flavobacteriaceae bacterium]
MIWTEDDLRQLQQLSQRKELVEQQIARFERGVEPVVLVSPCAPGNGIEVMNPGVEKSFLETFHSNEKWTVSKFVPASGAASRMFKHLFEQDESNALFAEFVANISSFAFYPQLEKLLEGEALSPDLLVSKVLSESGLNFARLPKGAIPFHRTNEQSFTAFEEHVKEALTYANFNHKASIHYTVGGLFSNELREQLLEFSKRIAGVNEHVEISFSTQFPSTDTIAVTHDNKPFRSTDGALLFRPGGHGSLLQNLQLVEEDVIFIKNIDNVVPDGKRSVSDNYKKVLGGYLMQLISERNELLSQLKADDTSQALAARKFLARFIKETTIPDAIPELITLLNAPIRVAGMVRNQGEPGGGPFWVETRDGILRPQIVEKAQIDLSDDTQRDQVEKSTHFNPVDIVCHTKDEAGKKYDLSNFVDAEQAFITEKTVQGKPVKALEHPGLWNGAMAQWLTVFVEVPLATFAPVKTVNDLLRDMHQ